jgi:hypothetical protein
MLNLEEKKKVKKRDPMRPYLIQRVPKVSRLKRWYKLRRRLANEYTKTKKNHIPRFWQNFFRSCPACNILRHGLLCTRWRRESGLPVIIFTDFLKSPFINLNDYFKIQYKKFMIWWFKK